MKKLLAIVASFAVLLTLTACNDQKDEKESEKVTLKSFDEERNLVVIGAGAAGLSAAIEASNNGTKDIVVLEKANYIGGVSFLSQGMIAGYDTRFTNALGITHTANDLYLNLMNNASYRLDKELAKITVDNSKSTIEFLDELGVPFLNQVVVAYGPLAMMHVMDGGGMAMKAPFEKAIQENEIDLRLENQATGLITDKDGNVVGVSVKTKDKEYTIGANAVILATGGYAANAELTSLLDPSYKGVIGIGHENNDGDGLIMASNAGAATSHTSHLMAVLKDYEILHDYNGNSTTANVSGLISRGESVIFTSKDGERFMNERNLGYMSQDLNQPILDQMQRDDNPYVYAIFDEQAKLDGKANRALGLEYVNAKTIEELANKLGMSETTLANTVKAYNAAVNNYDEFGRKVVREMVGPFYAVKIAPSPIITYGGVLRSSHGEALRADNSVINGLYVAGEVSCNSAYMGFTLSNAITWGRIAAINASDYIINGPRVIDEVITEDEVKEEVSLKNGTFTAKVPGHNDLIEVSITIENDKIKDVTVLSHQESAGIADKALIEVPRLMVEKNSLDVDIVTGATVTSKAIMNACKEALK